MNPPDLNVKVVVKVRGMWKLALLTFLMRFRSTRHDIHVHVSDGHGTKCMAHLPAVHQEQTEQKPPSLTGQ